MNNFADLVNANKAQTDSEFAIGQKMKKEIMTYPGAWSTGSHVHLGYEVKRRNGWVSTNTSQYAPYSDLESGFLIDPIDRDLSGRESNQWTLELANDLFTHRPDWKDTFYDSLENNFQKRIFNSVFGE